MDRGDLHGMWLAVNSGRGMPSLHEPLSSCQRTNVAGLRLHRIAAGRVDRRLIGKSVAESIVAIAAFPPIAWVVETVCTDGVVTAWRV